MGGLPPELIEGFGTGRVLGVISLASGLILVLLGLGGAFTFAGCPPGAYTCIPVYSLDLLSIVAGVVGVAAGIIVLRRRHH